MKKLFTLFAVCLLAVAFSGCIDNDAWVASHNISKDADMFRIKRRIVFYDSINAEYMLSIEGACSIEYDEMDQQLEVTCKTPEGYKKHFLGLSNNVTYFAEHLEASDVSVQHYKVIFKPRTLIPDVEVNY